MDEPLSNLDALLRLQMRTELKRLHRELKKTFVFVTHDQEEAMTLATRVAVLRDGKLVQFDKPKTDLSPPGEPLRRRVHRPPGDEHVRGPGGTVACSRPTALSLPRRHVADGAVVLGIRPEQVEIVDASAGDAVPFRSMSLNW